MDRLAAPPPEPDEADEGLCQAVRGAVLTALTEKQRQVVEMYFFEGLSQAEIARELRITQQVVHKRLYGTSREGRLIGGALGRLRTALWPLAHRSGWTTPAARP